MTMKVQDLMTDMLKNGLDLSFLDDSRSGGQFNKFLKLRLSHSNSLYEKRTVKKKASSKKNKPFSAISEESKSEYNDGSESKFNYGF